MLFAKTGIPYAFFVIYLRYPYKSKW